MLSRKRSVFVCLAVAMAGILSVAMWRNVTKDLYSVPRDKKNVMDSRYLSLGPEIPSRVQKIPMKPVLKPIQSDKRSFARKSSGEKMVSQRIYSTRLPKIKKVSHTNLKSNFFQNSVAQRQRGVSSDSAILRETPDIFNQKPFDNQNGINSKQQRSVLHPLKKKSFGNNSHVDLISLKRRFPRVMIIGFGKAYINTLFQALKTRPNIVGLNFERRFYTKQYKDGIYNYLNAFPQPPNDGFVIEQSPDYIVNIFVPKRIKSFAKTLDITMDRLSFAVVIQDPIDRALLEYLDWSQKRQQKHESSLKPFHEMVLSRTGKVNENLPFIKKSYYTIYVLRWLRMFNESKICFVCGELLVVDPYYEIQLLEQCLGQKLEFNKNTFYKEGGNFCISTVDGNVCMSNSTQKILPTLPLQVKAKLIDYFRPMAESLFQMIGRKMEWRNFNT